jgi:transcriptional regulator with XRE-family HTH domain
MDDRGDIGSVTEENELGARVRSIRAAAGLTIREVAQRAGIATSSISKIENNQLSPTYENIIKLARGLGVDIAELFSDAHKQPPHGRRSITRRGEGKVHRNRNYHYEMLCTDLSAKKMVPLKAKLKSRSLADFSSYITHEGEELLLVLSGKVRLMTEFYEPVVLHPGDCVYFDSSMGHVCLVEGVDEAEVFWVCSSNDVMSLVSAEAAPEG